MKEIFKSIDYYCDEFIENKNFITIKSKSIKSLSLFLFRDLDCDLCTVVGVPEKEGILIKYLYSYRKQNYFFILEQKVKDEFESLSEVIPALNWFERELYDMYGLKPVGHRDLRPLAIYPENYPKDFHPMLDDNLKDKEIDKDAVYEYKDIESEGVYTVPVGPIHAGVIEPGHFRFSMSGEPILQLEIRHFWKHRGIEKLCEGKSVDEVLNISEKISGDNALSHALAFVQCIEKICNIKVPEFACYSRMIGAELERISCNFSDISGAFQDAGYSFGAQGINVLKEDIMRLMKKISESRFLKGFIIVGGVDKNITSFHQEILSVLDKVEKRFNGFIHLLKNSSSILERLETTGIISPKIVKDLSCVGFTASASGRFSDMRKSHPYLLYDKIDFSSLVLPYGDVSARAHIKVKDIINSISIISVCLNHISLMKKQSLKVKYELCDGEAFGYSQSNRGNIMDYVKIKDKKVVRFKPRDPSFMNWQSIQFAVLGDVIGDFPLVNKSLNLSYAGNDL